MSKVRITVTESNCRGGYCKKGDEYIVEDLCPPICHELWHCIYPSVYALQNGANLDYGLKKEKYFDAKCPDSGRVCIHGECIGELFLQVMTRKMCHEFYKAYENDSALYMDMSKFKPYTYNQETVDKYYEEQQNPTRILYGVMLDNKVIGELKLKYIDYEKKECTLGIVLQNDTVKGRGYGSRAEKLAIDIAFNKLGMKVVYADAVLKNLRSQHALEKLGFQFIREDDMLRYYEIFNNDVKEV